jgi:translation initiation factor eIF-2B subunit delta
MVFIDSDYVLGNGCVVASIGSSMVAYLASQYKVPVIAWCETYKFTTRVNIDQIKNNLLWDSEVITSSQLLSYSKKDADEI